MRPYMVIMTFIVDATGHKHNEMTYTAVKSVTWRLTRVRMGLNRVIWW